MSYEIKITDLLERRIKVKRNEQSVGNIDPGETKASYRPPKLCQVDNLIVIN